MTLYVSPAASTLNSNPPEYDDSRPDVELITVRGFISVASTAGFALCANVPSFLTNESTGDMAVFINGMPLVNSDVTTVLDVIVQVSLLTLA